MHGMQISLQLQTGRSSSLQLGQMTTTFGLHEIIVDGLLIMKQNPHIIAMIGQAIFLQPAQGSSMENKYTEVLLQFIPSIHITQCSRGKSTQLPRKSQGQLP